VGRRAIKERRENMKVQIPKNAVPVTDPQAIADVFHSVLNAEPIHDREKEHFWIVGLNTRNNIKYIELVSLGTLNASLVHPREAFRFAVLQGSSSIILAHNHPSDDMNPSEDDLSLTRRLCDAGKILGIEVLDHIIVANNTNGYTSFKVRGLMM
jgi:DNA repair protein RadC